MIIIFGIVLMMLFSLFNSAMGNMVLATHNVVVAIFLMQLLLLLSKDPNGK